MGYDAFLSYSHAADGQLAPALQSGLQKFAKSWRQRKALNVFRDKTGLSANPGLWSSIQEVLDDTEYFVLLSSPDAAASPWVNREIEYWKANKPPNTILPVLTDGELFWDEAANDFDRTRSTAVPEALSGAFSEEPLWADLRWAHGETDLSLRHTKFRDAVAELAAPMHGKPKDELEGEDVRQQRRTRRLVRGAVVVLAVLTVAAITASVFAVRNADRAEDRRKLAVSRQLAGQAAANADDDLQQSLLLANEAYEVAPTVEAEGAVLGVANEATELQAIAPLYESPVADVLLVRDQDLLLAASVRGTVTYWGTEEQEVVEEFPDEQPGILSFVHDAEFTNAATIDISGRVVYWDLDDPGPTDEFRLASQEDQDVYGAAMSPDGQTLATIHIGGELMLWDAQTGELIGAPVAAHTGVGSAVAFSPDGTQLATASQSPDGTIALWNLTPTPVEVVRYFHGLGQFASALAFSPDGDVLATGGVDGLVAFQDIDAIEPFGATEFPATAEGHVATVNDLQFANDNVLVSSGIDGRLLRWDVDNGVTYPGARRLRPVGLTSLSTIGPEVVTGGDDGTIALFDFDSRRVPGEVVDVGTGVQELAVSRGGALVAVSTSEHSVRFFDAEANKWRDEEIDLGRAVAWSAAFAPDGESIALGLNPTGRGTIALSTLDGELIGEAEPASDRSGVGYAAFSPDGKYVASGGFNGDLTLWKVSDDGLSEAIHVSEAGAAELGFGGALAFSPDSKTLAYGSFNDNFEGVVLQYDIENEEVLDQQIVVDDFLSSLEYAPSGDLIAVGETNGRITLWDPANARPRGNLVGHAGLIFGMTFVDNGTRLVSGSAEGDVRLWDVATGQPVGSELRAHDGDIGAFAGDSQSGVVASGGFEDGRVILWDFDVDDALASNCDLAGRNLTREEWDQFLPDESYHVTCEEWPSGE